MTTHTHRTRRSGAFQPFFGFFVILVAMALCGVVSGAAASGGKQAPLPERQLSPRGIAPALLNSSADQLRVTVYLADNSVLEKLPDDSGQISARLPGAAVARAEAIRNPNNASPQEKRIGATMDELRNAALLKSLRTAARSGTEQSEEVAKRLEDLGAKVLFEMPMPNSITAIVPESTLEQIGAWPEVTAVEPAKAAHWESSPIDGSETWHSNGFTGGGTSADGLAGPDFVAFDQGVRTTHQSFRARVVGDCATCLGTGASRVISPAGRTDFSGTKHGNNVAGIVASTDLQNYGTTGAPYPATWQLKKGEAYGLDKLYDPEEAEDGYRWMLGVTYNGEPGVTDLPEVVNYSAGIYEDTTDLDTVWSLDDAIAERLGILTTVSAGNCGVQDPSFTNCADGPHRVSSPGTNFNVLTVGGLDIQNQPYNQGAWTAWANSSPGPTWGGRKKPDLIASPTAGPGASATDDTSYTNPGVGTSFAAPQAAAGAVLLASVGVYSPTAQRAILINSATPIQSQTYWTPTTGWGALNLDGAFTQRGYYANGSVTAAGANGVRFFKQTGVASGDRTTLTWNRRTVGNVTGTLTYNTLTNLDLAQVDVSSGSTTATGGSDAADTVDTNPTVSASNPMPGNGTDGGDNVEQVRSTTSGTEVYKVKAMSSIDGATSEPFSIAGAHPIQALQTPIPTVTISPAASTIGVNGSTTINGTVTNPSADLALSSASITLSLPAGTSLVSGSATQAIGTIAASGTANVSWQVKGNTGGDKDFDAAATGTTYGETFSGTGSTSITVDGNPPTLSVGALPTYSASSSIPVSWSATDAESTVANYDVETSTDGTTFTPLLSASTSTSTTVNGNDGDTVTVRVRARDSVGNVSNWSTVSTTIDTSPPVITFGSANSSVKGQITVPVSVTNTGAPVTASYTFAINGGSPKPLTTASVTFSNLGTAIVNATLSVTATDALGRAVTRAQTYSVSSRFKDAALALSNPKVKSRVATVRGTVASGVPGPVAILVKRVGKKGTKRVSKKAAVKSRKYNLKVRLKAGTYRVTVTVPTANGFVGASKTKKFKVK